MAEEIFCPVPDCGAGPFKSTQGLFGHLRLKHADWLVQNPNWKTEATSQEGQSQAQTTAVAKKGQSPLEQIIKELELPKLADGQAEVFDHGVHYGIRSVLVGVRVAQELSAMGVQQATPIIKMAQEMRMSESEAAKTVASELAEATLNANKDVIGAIDNLKMALGTGSDNPAQRMLATIQAFPQMLSTMQQFMGMMGMPMGAMGGQGQQQPPPQGQFKPQPIEKRSASEWEEQDV
jgi:hypothetical protein